MTKEAEVNLNGFMDDVFTKVPEEQQEEFSKFRTAVDQFLYISNTKDEVTIYRESINKKKAILRDKSSTKEQKKKALLKLRSYRKSLASTLTDIGVRLGIIITFSTTSLVLACGSFSCCMTVAAGSVAFAISLATGVLAIISFAVTAIAAMGLGILGGIVAYNLLST